MAEQQYVLSQTAAAAERERLDLWEQIEDARSQRHLAALGIQKVGGVWKSGLDMAP